MPHVSQNSVCPKCGRSLASTAAQGLCAKCLFAVMLDGGSLDSSPQSTAHKAALPRAFAGYQLLEEVARGGMGIVYRARQTSIQRSVALKVLAAGQFASPDFVRRFRTEAEAVASLDHPNIVPIYEVGECEGQPFFSMRFIEGGSLAERIEAPLAPFSVQEAAGLLVKLARAVHYAHQRGILHRDIKPGNVLLDPQGEPHLTDFGLAKLVEKDSTLTRTMAMLGTPSYMSPEQARGEAKQLTTAVDVYGLGAVLYELLTGQPPFAGGTTMETVRLVLDKEPRRPSLLSLGLDRDMETISLKCLEKDPLRRYGSAEALAADLERWQRHEPILARPATGLERMTKWVRRNRVGFASLLIIALLLVSGVTVSHRQAARAMRAEALATQRLGEAQRNEHRAEEASRELVVLAERRRDTLVRMYVASGNALVEGGNAFTGLLHFLEALRLEQGNPVREDVHRRRLASILHTAPQLKQVWVHPGALGSARFNPEGTQVVCGDDHGDVQIFDATTGEPFISPIRTDPPSALAWFTRGGRYLVTADTEGKLRHWDPTTGQPAGPVLPTQVKSTEGRTHFDTLDYSPDGRWLVAILAGGVRFLTVPSGEPVGPWMATTSRVVRVRFNPDGQTALISGAGPSLQIVEVPSGRLVWSPPDLESPVRFAEFSPNGQRVVTVSGASSQDLDIWHAARGTRVIKGFQSLPHSYDLQLSPDGRRIALGNTSDALVLSADSGRPVSELMKHESHILQFEFSPNGRELATASFDRTARVWESETGRPLIPRLRHGMEVTEAHFSPDGERLLTACQDGTTRLWGLRGNEGARLTLRHRLSGEIKVRVSADARHVLAFCASPTVRVWDIRSGQISAEWSEAGNVTDAQFNRDGSRVAVAVADGTVQLREVSTGAGLFHVSHRGKVNCLTFSPDGQTFLTGGDDAKVRLWKATDGRVLGPPLIHGGALSRATFSVDGQQVVTGSEDKKARIWDVKTGSLVGLPLELGSAVGSVDLNVDGTRIYTLRKGDGAALLGAMRLWDATTRKPLAPEQPLYSAGSYPTPFSPDGRKFLMLQDATTVALYDAQTGRRIAPLLEHRFLPSGFAFSPDGRLALTRANRVARVWDASTGDPVSPPLVHKGYLQSADWSADGRELITTANDGTLSIWDVSPSNASVAELERLAEVLAAHRLDPQTGLVPLTPTEIRGRWKVITGRPTDP